MSKTSKIVKLKLFSIWNGFSSSNRGTACVTALCRQGFKILIKNINAVEKFTLCVSTTPFEGSKKVSVKKRGEGVLVAFRGEYEKLLDVSWYNDLRYMWSEYAAWFENKLNITFSLDVPIFLYVKVEDIEMKEDA